ncbi:tetraspanin-12 [Citrus sinensis]|nr:tetraspanin-12 [Citrus sinensis]
MPRFSNAMFIALNLISLAMGFAAVFCSAYVQMHDGSACQKTLEMPLLVTGLFLLIVSTLGLVGACCRTDWLLCIYLFVMLISILGLIAFTVFVLIVTNTFVGKKVSQNRLHDYSYWLQNRLADGKNWQEIRSCLADANVCRNLGNKDLKDWSLVQSGCCKPPVYCGLERKNATFWTMPENGPAVSDSDCAMFSNDQKQLCYDCNSCKGGVLANIKREWRLLAVLNACVIGFLIIIFWIGCCVRKNIRYDQFIGY